MPRASAQLLRLPVLEDLPRGVVARRAGDAPSGMDPGAAQVETAHGGAVAGPAWHGATEEERAQVQVAVEDVPLSQPETALEVDRRQDVALQDGHLEAGRDLV